MSVHPPHSVRSEPKAAHRPPTSDLARGLAILVLAVALTACSPEAAAPPAADETAPTTAETVAGETSSTETQRSPRDAQAESPVGVEPASESESESEAASVAPAALPTPSCSDLRATPFDAEGPFFTPGSPERSDLREPGDPGTPLRIVGYVVDTDCRPLPGAKIDVWQTDDAGNYDNEGYRYRGHLFTDEAGAYTFDTILPGTYPGRPRHIHLHVHAPGEAEPTLTSQLYFRLPDGTDDTAGVDPALVVDLASTSRIKGLAGRFDFVLGME